MNHDTVGEGGEGGREGREGGRREGGEREGGREGRREGEEGIHVNIAIVHAYSIDKRIIRDGLYIITSCS